MAGMPVAWHLKYMPHHISAPSQAKVFFTMFTSEIFYMHVRLQTLQGENLLLVPVGWDGIGWTVGTGGATAQNIVQRPTASNVTPMYY